VGKYTITQKPVDQLSILYITMVMYTMECKSSTQLILFDVSEGGYELVIEVNYMVRRSAAVLNKFYTKSVYSTLCGKSYNVGEVHCIHFKIISTMLAS